MRAKAPEAVKALFAVGLGVLAFGSSVAALGALASPSVAHVTFAAAGPAGMKIEGTTTDLAVSDDGATLSVDVPLANVSTGIALRDHHMREKYLEVPSATLQVARSALKLPAAGGGVEVDVPATLRLHGQSHPVTVHYEARSDSAGFSARGRFRVNMNDYGITVPSYLGVTVKPDVDVVATFHVAGN
jgi:polyisoprenoid-binding protein YceI